MRNPASGDDAATFEASATISSLRAGSSVTSRRSTAMPVLGLAAAELDFGERHQQRRIVARNLGGQVLRRALQVSALQQRLRQRLAQLAVGRIEQHRATLHFDRLIVAFAKAERLRQLLELRGSRRDTRWRARSRLMTQ